GTTTMTEGLATPLRSVLTCGGCCQRFDDGSRRPKFLSCFHTACLICLRKGFSDGKVKCPTCTRVTETKSADSLPDNTQLCTILLNMSSLNLHEASQAPSRDTCSAHAARINFWCDSCRMPLCRDCTVLAHRDSQGHKVRDHDQAVAVLRAEVRSSVSEARTLLQETRRLRHDQRKYLLRQLDAARAYEKQLKSELKQLDNDKRDETRGLDRMETDIEQETSLVSLHETVKRAGSMVTRLADDLATAKAVLADSFLTLGKLNRSQDDLDAIELKSSTSGRGSPAAGGGVPSAEASPARRPQDTPSAEGGRSTPEGRRDHSAKTASLLLSALRVLTPAAAPGGAHARMPFLGDLDLTCEKALVGHVLSSSVCHFWLSHSLHLTSVVCITITAVVHPFSI
ncbi:hypothetical protein C7M84_004853, partial [Penaeus vannamei]